MNTNEFIQDCCIACLGTDTIMYELKKDEEKLKLFLTYIDIDFKVSDHFLNICKHCNEKLIASHTFFEQVNRSINWIQKNKREVGDSEHLYLTTSKSDEAVNSNENEPDKLENNSTAIFKEVSKMVEEFEKGFKERRSCLFCNFIAENKRTISTHMALFHKDKKSNWCKECNDSFVNIIEHQGTHKNKHTCPFCNKEYLSSNYVRHLLNHADIFRCNICKKSFKSSVGLKKHGLVHSACKSYICQNCGKNFTHASSFKHHLKTHDNFHDMVEHFCKPNSLSEQSMERQNCITKDDLENRRSRSDDFCKECNKTVENFEIHNKRCHTHSFEQEPIDNHLKCDFCNKTFSNNYKLRLHMRTHTGELPYKCSYCDKRMTNRSRLIDHERVHTKEKPYICNICGKGYGQRSALNTHLKQHTGKSEVCEICNKTFCRKSQLKLHMDKHMGLKPFLCNQCGRVFAQKSHLTDHLKGHGDERPYQCEFCEKAFKKKTLLKGHLKLHQDTRPYQCNFCEYSCYTAYRLQQHNKLHINQIVGEKMDI